MAYISVPQSLTTSRPMDVTVLRSVAYYVGLGLLAMAIAVPAAIATFGAA